MVVGDNMLTQWYKITHLILHKCTVHFMYNGLSQFCKKILYWIQNIYLHPGIPSQPVIMNVSSGSESATITLRVDSFGVFVASDFTFVVSVFSPSDTTNPAAVRMITPDSIDSPIVTIVVEGLSKGTYLFTVTSRNIFSPSFYIPSLSSQVFVEQSKWKCQSTCTWMFLFSLFGFFHIIYSTKVCNYRISNMHVTCTKFINT